MDPSRVQRIARSTLGRSVRVSKLADDVFLLENVFPKAVFAALLGEAKDTQELATLSPLIDDNEAEEHLQEQRSSRSAALPQQSAKVFLSMKRVQEFAGSLDPAEPLQLESPTLVYYAADSKEAFGLHHDEGVLVGDSELRPSTDLNRRWRKWTMFLYLTSVPETGGGRTRFPRLGVDVQPAANSAVLFRKLRELAVLTCVGFLPVYACAAAVSSAIGAGMHPKFGYLIGAVPLVGCGLGGTLKTVRDRQSEAQR